jgi:hypothetical protein
MEDKSHGLIFRDCDTDELMIAIFGADRESFLEIFSIDETILERFKDIGHNNLAFVEFSLRSNTVAEFEFLFAFTYNVGDEEKTSRSFIESCFDINGTQLIAETFQNCYRESYGRPTRLDS